MVLEIERNFLIKEEYVTPAFYDLCGSIDKLIEDVRVKGTLSVQGYLPRKKGEELVGRLNVDVGFNPVEYRLKKVNGRYFFTAKDDDGGLTRNEVPSVELDVGVFNEYWGLTEGRRVIKKQLRRRHNGETVKFNVYQDRELITAEFEVKSEDDAKKIVPIGEEITGKYRNRNLAK